MQKRATERRIPEGSPIYFSVTVEGREDHDFRIPRPSVVGRLVQPFIEGGLWEASADAIDMLRAEVTEEAVGAMLGVCWAHRGLDLEADRKTFDRGADGLLAYGDAVLDEIHDAGYSTSEVSLLVSQVGTRVFESLIPSGSEVDDRVGFSAPQPATRISSSLT